MPPKNSTKIFVCPKCHEEIKPMTKFVKQEKSIIKEKEILSYFEYEINKINYDDFMKSSFNIKSEQSGALKILFQSLSKYLDEIVLKITEKQISFLKVIEDNIMFHLNLNFLNFEYYLVNENKSAYDHSEEIKETEIIYLKVNLKEIKPIVKNIKHDDLITFRKEKNCDFWELIIHNNEKQTNSTYKFKNNVDKISEIKINTKIFKCNLLVPYDLIDETIKKMDFLLPEEIVININEQYLDFSAENNEKTISCENKIFFSENGSINNSSEEYKTKIINEKYSFNKFKIIQSFLNLCNCINIFTNHNDVLIYSISVASLGELKVCIAPIID